MNQDQPKAEPSFWRPGSQGLWIGFFALALFISFTAWFWPFGSPKAQAGTPASANNPPAVAPGTPGDPALGVPGGDSASPTMISAVAPTTPVSLPTGVTPPEGVTLTYSDTKVAGSGSGADHPYIVGVEEGTDLTANSVAKEVAKTLNNKRSWRGGGKDKFTLVDDPSKATFSILFAADATSCGGAPSCTIQRRTVIIDVAAWNEPADTYAKKLADYRAYLVNHGVGYVLGNNTTTCPKAGYVASVMQPQDANLIGCKANPWVYPASK